MFSFFEGGIEDINYKEFVSFENYVNKVKVNPNKSIIEEIRNLRLNDVRDDHGKELFKELKKRMPYITPGGLMRKRSLGDEKFDENFIQGSGYVYLDIDSKNLNEVDQLKKDFITKNKDKVALVCKSISGGGISILVRINRIVKSNLEYESIRNYLGSNLFSEFKFDPKAEGIGRALFESYDPDLFVSYENVINVDSIVVEKFGYSYLESYSEKPENQYKLAVGCKNNTRIFQILDIKEVLDKTKREKEITVLNKYFDFKEEEFAKLYFPRMIKDGQKRKVFSTIFRVYVYLNPELTYDYVISFIWYINLNYTDSSRWNFNHFKKFISDIITSYDSGKLKPYLPKLKRFHSNKNSKLTRDQRRNLACKVNGLYRRSVTYELVQDAKKALIDCGEKLNYTKVARLIDKDPKTVKLYWSKMDFNLKSEIDRLNNDIEIDQSESKSK